MNLKKPSPWPRRLGRFLLSSGKFNPKILVFIGASMLALVLGIATRNVQMILIASAVVVVVFVLSFLEDWLDDALDDDRDNSDSA